MPFFGCIADDFTGASDAASYLVKGGMQVVMLNGVPKGPVELAGVDGVVIALKTRTQETTHAVADSLAALRFLQAQGVTQFYLKYCSTFDSTPQGNIGPIADAVLDALGQPYTLLCPALPENGRTVREGVLYVKGVPLAESPMKHHPLTPMWDSRIPELMCPQSRYGCIVWPRSRWAEALPETKQRFYLVPDYETAADGSVLVERFGELPLLTGGSGLLEPLAKKRCPHPEAAPAGADATTGPALLLAGSCSAATREQIEVYKAAGGRTLRLDPLALLEGRTSAEALWEAVRGQLPVLIYSSDTPEAVQKAQQQGAGRVAQALEQAMADLARFAVQAGVTRLIVAGGETSGAVTRALALDEYRIGGSVAPGVPVMTPLQAPQLRLVLKSGNFGQPDFFARALRQTEGGVQQ